MSSGHLQCPEDPEDPEDILYVLLKGKYIHDIFNVLRIFYMFSMSSPYNGIFTMS